MYVLAGIGTAVLVAAVVVVVGSLAGASGDERGVPTAQQSLPPGHPSLDGGETGATPAATTSSSVKRSISELEKKSKARPKDAGVQLKLGDAYFLAQQYDEAEGAFDKALALDPGNPVATVRLAMVWHAEGDTPRALRAIRGVIVDHPGNQEAHYSLAIVYFSQERVQAARDEWAEAAIIDPTSTIGRRSQNFVDLIDGEEPSEDD
jgi:cytochrome c-type biogenesis protein CcmH/NrfG